MNTTIRIATSILFLVATTSQAQWDRSETWEMGVTLLDLSGTFVSGENGSSLDVDDEIGWGFTGAYNFTSRLGLGLDIHHSRPNYVARLVPDGPDPAQRIRAELGVDVMHLKGVFNLLDNELTPYLEVGAGWTRIDSNIVSGASGQICWWDPWWGYICNSYFDTYSETRTSMSYAMGVRYEFASEWVVKASWGVHEIDAKRSEDIEIDKMEVSFSWQF